MMNYSDLFRASYVGSEVEATSIAMEVLLIYLVQLDLLVGQLVHLFFIFLFVWFIWPADILFDIEIQTNIIWRFILFLVILTFCVAEPHPRKPISARQMNIYTRYNNQMRFFPSVILAVCVITRREMKINK
jgi:hypothetical protein